MGDRQTLKILGQVVETRDLRRRQAEARVGREAARGEALLIRRWQEDARLADSHLQWAQCLDAPRVSLEALAGWSAAIETDAATLRRTDLEITLARAEEERARLAWRASLAHRDAAEALRADAARKARRREDEAALAEVSDRASQTWRRR